jgi:RNA polymerase sigma-70 factor, ECF subfamily
VVAVTAAVRSVAEAGMASTVPDDHAFALLAACYRPELRRHCLRMLRSPEQAEDAVQETLLRAWRSRTGFAGRASIRSWLYRIATNVCLDEIRRDRASPLRVAAPPSGPDDPLAVEAAASADPQPDAVLEAREAVEQAVATMLELLPPKQRGVLILCEVLRFPATETAELLDTSVAAVNSALQRARATLRARQPARPAPRPAPPGSLRRALLARYVGAVRRHDPMAVIALARADAVPSPPPRPVVQVTY